MLIGTSPVGFFYRVTDRCIFYPSRHVGFRKLFTQRRCHVRDVVSALD